MLCLIHADRLRVRCLTWLRQTQWTTSNRPSNCTKYEEHVLGHRATSSRDRQNPDELDLRTQMAAEITLSESKPHEERHSSHPAGEWASGE
jgi:hypothetical protein